MVMIMGKSKSKNRSKIKDKQMMYQTAIVTGASAGIGQAIAEQLAEHGVNLILVARRQGRLQELAVSLASRVDSHVIACDLTNHAEVKQQFKDLPELFTDADILVNCAGLALGLEAAGKCDWQANHDLGLLCCAGPSDSFGVAFNGEQ